MQGTRINTKDQLDGFIKFVAEIIRQAVLDYQKKPDRWEDGENYTKDAERFLFKDKYLENFLFTYKADGTITPDFEVDPQKIRYNAKNLILRSKGIVEYNKKRRQQFEELRDESRRNNKD